MPLRPSIFSPPLPLEFQARPDSAFDSESTVPVIESTVPLILTARPLKQPPATTWAPPDTADYSQEHTSIGFEGEQAVLSDDRTDPDIRKKLAGWNDEFGSTDPDFNDETKF